MNRLAATFLAVVFANTVLAAEAAGREVVIEGLVVNERHVPQAGVRVESYSHLEDAAVETSEDGRYRLTVAVPESPFQVSVVLRASRTGDSRAATGIEHLASVPHVPHRAATLMLEKTVPLQIAVRTEGAPATSAALQLVIRHHHWPVAVLKGRTDGEGNAVLHVAPRRAYEIWLIDRRWETVMARADSEVTQPGASVPPRVVLETSPARSVQLLLRDKTTGKPVQGATAAVAGTGLPWWNRDGESDAAGLLIVDRVPQDRRARIQVRERNAYRSTSVTITPQEDAKTVRLAPAVKSDISIHLAEDSPRPPPEADMQFLQEVRYRRDPLQVSETGDTLTGRVLLASVQGFVTVGTSHAARVHKLVRAGDESYAARNVSLIRASKLQVTFVAANGQPLGGRKVRLMGTGFLEDEPGQLTSARLAKWRTTDASGTVDFHGVFLGSCVVRIASSDDLPAGFALKHVNIEEGTTTRITQRLPAPVPVTLDVTIDGRPGLRGDMRVKCNGRLVHADVDPRAHRVSFLHLPEEGEEGLDIQVWAHGFTHYETRHRGPLPVGGVRLALNLETALVLEVQLETANEDWFSPSMVQLHRWEPARQAWVFERQAQSWMGRREEGVDEPPIEPFIRRLSAGRYRLVHTPTGASTEPFEIDASKQLWKKTLKIPAQRRIQGWLVGRAAPFWDFGCFEDLDGAPALTLERDPSVAPIIEIRDRASIEKHGRFWLRLAANQAARVRLTHPLIEDQIIELAPDATDGFEIETKPKAVLMIPIRRASPQASPNSEVLAPYDARPLISRITEAMADVRRRAPGETVERLANRSPRVWWWDKDALPEARWVIHPRVVERESGREQIRVGFSTPGPHTLLIDCDDQAPLLLRNLVVAEEGSSLPAQEIGSGATARIRWTLPRDPVPGRVVAWVEPLGEESIEIRTRRRMGRTATNANKHAYGAGATMMAPTTGVLTLPGLAPGRYRLVAQIQSTHGDRSTRHRTIEEAIDVKGTGDIDVVADFRPVREVIVERDTRGR